MDWITLGRRRRRRARRWGPGRGGKRGLRRAGRPIGRAQREGHVGERGGVRGRPAGTLPTRRRSRVAGRVLWRGRAGWVDSTSSGREPGTRARGLHCMRVAWPLRLALRLAFAMPRCLGGLVLVPPRGAFRRLGLAGSLLCGPFMGRGEWALLGFIGQYCGIAHQPAAYILLHKQV